VLNTFDRPLEEDALLPVGRLREQPRAMKRANALIITKCPDFQTFDQDLIRANYKKFNIPVFFSRYHYMPLKALTDRHVNEIQRIIIVSAIAHPVLLGQAFDQQQEIHYKSFKDHHFIIH
jgi:tetraacyldisaccharide 4'-kinase